MFIDTPGYLGETGEGRWEAIHADWPAYPGDHSPEHALLRLGDFPPETMFTCIDVIDECALFVGEVGINEPNMFSEKHMHVSIWLDDLAVLGEKGLVDGIESDLALTPDEMNWKRQLGPVLWSKVRSGEVVLGAEHGGEFVRLVLPEPVEPREEWDDEVATRDPARMAMFAASGDDAGTTIRLRSSAQEEIERLARLTLRVPPSVQDRVLAHLSHGLFDSAVRDLGAALESRMRGVTASEAYGQRLIEVYIEKMLETGGHLPARVKILRQELRSIFKFIRNEFAHALVDLPSGRGYALVSRLCWHVRDVELVQEQLGLWSPPRESAGDYGVS